MNCSRRHWHSAGLLAAWTLAVVFLPAALSAAAPESAVTPAPLSSSPKHKWWFDRQEKMNARVKQGNVDLVFIGDSITEAWEDAGKGVWSEFYGHRNAVNLGISGDRTQHVLWRLEHGNLDGIAPKLAVVMIGTNNSGDNTPEDIAAGVKAIVAKIHEKTPTTKVLLLAIFPRDEVKDRRRQVNTKANAIIAKLNDGKTVIFKDIGGSFLNPDGTIVQEKMTKDKLHLVAAGYKAWAEVIEPTVAAVVGPK